MSPISTGGICSSRDTQGNFTTLSTRAYYRTLEGTLVYGDMSSCTFRPNTIYNPLAVTA